MDRSHQNDEIDVTQLVISAVKKIRDYFWVIVICCVLGAALGFLHFSLATKKYSSTMVVSSDILTKSFSQKVVDNIQTYVKQGNRKAISHLLNISEETADALANIKVDNATEIVDGKDHERFMVVVQVFDPSQLPLLQKGILYYLANNEFVKVRVDQNRVFLTGLIRKTEQEISDLEEFKTQIYKGDFWKRVEGNVMFDPTSVNSKIVELTKTKLELEKELQLVNSVQVIEGFNIFERPSYPILALSVSIGLVVGCITAVLFIAAKSIEKMMKGSNTGS